ncbi:hypothetical protein DPSP01_006236 [Paraphaeosphaeria sporulosa]
MDPGHLSPSAVAALIPNTGFITQMLIDKLLCSKPRFPILSSTDVSHPRSLGRSSAIWPLINFLICLKAGVSGACNNLIKRSHVSIGLRAETGGHLQTAETS